MSSSHFKQIERLLGAKGGLFVLKAIFAITGRPLLAGTTVIGVEEYCYHSAVIPPGHKSNRMRLDLLFVVLSPVGKINIGIEVKTTESDLLFSEKIQYELIADYLFLATPRNLIPAALYVITNLPSDVASKIGLLDLNSIEIVVKPKQFETDIDALDVVNSKRKHIIEVPYNSRSIAHAIFRENRKIQINEVYAGMLLKKYTPKLPSPGERHHRYLNSKLYQRLLNNYNEKKQKKSIAN